MTRQVHKLAGEQHGVKGHITSLNPLNPLNAPDPWERQALLELANGAPQVSSVEQIDGEEYLRLIRPLATEKGCLQCHGKQGYQVGDVRGAISASIPMEPLWAIMEGQLVEISITHLLLWFLGVCGIGIGSKRLSQRIGERDNILIKLGKEKDKSQQYLDVMGTILIALDTEGRVVLINKKGCEVLGYEEKEVVGKVWFDHFLPKDNSQKYKILYEQLMDGDLEVYEEDENFVITKTGKRKIVSWHNSILSDDSGRITGVLASGEDITSRKQVEEALRYSERRFELFMEHLPAVVFMKDECGRHCYVNKGFENVFGAKSEDIIGKTNFELFPEKTAAKLTEIDNEVLKNNKSYRYTENIPVEGRDRFLDTYKFVIPNMQHGSYLLAGISIDITDMKQTEEALRISEEKYHTIFSTAPNLITSVNHDGIIVDCNNAVKQVLGYDQDEIVGQPATKIIHPDYHRKIHEAVRTIFNKGRLYDHEHKMVRKDGRVIDVSLNSSALTDSAGQPERTLCIITDITGRKKAVQALEQKMQLAQTLLDNMPCVAMLLRTGTREIVAVNQMAANAGAVPGATCFDSWNQYEKPCSWCLAEKLWKTGKPQQLEVEDRGIDWEAYWIPLEDDLYLHYAFDITERRRIEKALQLSEERYRKQFEEALDGIFVADAETGILVDCNTAASKLVGREKSELIGMHQKDLHPVEDVNGGLSRSFKQHLDSKLGDSIGARVITKEGEIRDVAITANLIEVDGRKLLQGIFRDVTERKQAHEQRDAILATSMDGFAMVDGEGNFVDVNDAYCRQIGYDKQELLTMGICDVEVIESHEEIKQHIEKIVKEKKDRFETQQRRKDGSIVDFEICANHIPINKGMNFGFHRDITHRKQMEKSLRESEKKIRTLLNASTDTMLLIKPDGAIVDCNETFAAEWHRNCNDLLGTNAFSLLPPDVAEKRLAFGKKAFDDGSAVRFEDERGGRVFDNNICPIMDHKGDVTEIAIYSRELTTERTAQKKLAQALRSTEATVRTRTAELDEANKRLQSDIDRRAAIEQELHNYSEKLKALTSQLILGEEVHKREIALGLHDSIIQPLILLKMNINSLADSAAQDDLKASLGEILNLVDPITQNLRSLTFNLGSPILYELGLEAAIEEWMGDEVRDKHGISTRFENDGCPKPLAEEMKVCLFVATKELLMNAVKHSNARNVGVFVCRKEDDVVITVEDDGAGFDVEADSKLDKYSGYGLFSIQERLGYLGGRFVIESEPGGGTKAVLEAPLRTEKQERV